MLSFLLKFNVNIFLEKKLSMCQERFAGTVLCRGFDTSAIIFSHFSQSEILFETIGSKIAKKYIEKSRKFYAITIFEKNLSLRIDFYVPKNPFFLKTTVRLENKKFCF